MNRFEKVKKLLDDSVNATDFGAHGRFWVGLNRDQFVAHSVFARALLVIGDGANSNLVKALRGEAPFGSDTGTPGAFYARMPARRQPLADPEIQFIQQWIDDGCPDEPIKVDAAVDPSAGGPAADPTVHNNYWRDFDNWAMFQVTPEIQAAIDAFSGAATAWFTFANGSTSEDSWEQVLKVQATQDAIHLLAERQIETVVDYYGTPVPLLTLLDSYERFGDDSLPDDPMRPQDLRHNMNGPNMWFFWASFDDACIRLAIQSSFWNGHARALILGLMNDGLFRGRFPVVGFTADDQGKADMRAHVLAFADDDIPTELVKRYIDSGL